MLSKFTYIKAQERDKNSMNKIYTFLRKYKNKIILYSILLIIAVSFIYFALSKDSVSLKGLVFLLSALAYLGIFYGVRFIIFMQNKIKPLPKKVQKVLFSIFMVFAFFQSAAQLINFAIYFNSFYLILCSSCLALFGVFVYLLS